MKRSWAERRARLRTRLWDRRVAVSLLLLAALGAIGFGVMVYYNPFWIVDRGVNLYLRQRGVVRRSVAVDGNRIQYLEMAPAAAGAPDRPIVLVHGLGARATDWVTIIPELSKRGFHVYALDLLGYGESDRPAGGDYTLAGEERVVAGFLDALHLEQPDVAGWSMGGWIAMKLALDHPERVRRLLLYDSAGLYMPINFPLSLFAPEDRAGLDRLIVMIEPRKPHIRVPGIAVPGMLRRFRRNRDIINASFASMLSGREMLDFRLARLKMPVLIVWGTEDRLTPVENGLRLHDLVPQSVFVGIEGCGHLAIAECSGQLLGPTVRFLQAEPPLPPSQTILPSAR